MRLFLFIFTNIHRARRSWNLTLVVVINALAQLRVSPNTTIDRPQRIAPTTSATSPTPPPPIDLLPLDTLLSTCVPLPTTPRNSPSFYPASHRHPCLAPNPLQLPLSMVRQRAPSGSSTSSTLTEPQARRHHPLLRRILRHCQKRPLHVQDRGRGDAGIGGRRLV